MHTADAMPFTLRLETPDDDIFIYRLFSDTQMPQFAALALPPPQLKELLSIQYQARRQSYQWSYADADFAIIECRGEPVGRWVYRRRNGHLHIIDLEILPEHQNRGIGSAVLQAFLAESKSASLHVARHNPAQNLYRRLGFEEVPNAEMMMAMEWKSKGGEPGTA